MMIGLFTDAALIAIPTGIDFVKTSGWAALGEGDANYSYDAAVDAAYVTAHPRESFLSSNGRGFRLAETMVDVMQFGATGDGSMDDLAAINAAIAYVDVNKIGDLYLPAGDYRVSNTLHVPLLVSLRGPATPFPQAAYNPSYSNGGAVIFKDHGNHCIQKVGNPADGIYQQAAGFYNIGVRSSYIDHPTGDGFFIDRVGLFEMHNCSVYSVGGSGFVIGYTAEDVTGNILLKNLYVNNSAGSCYTIRARWVTGTMLVSDGGTIGMDVYNSTDCGFYECHHEGVQVAGIRLSGAVVNNVFTHHWVLCNYADTTAPAVASYFVSPGSAINRFISCRFLGRDAPGATAVTLDPNLYHTSFDSCSFYGFDTGIKAQGKFAKIDKCQFYMIYLPIEVQADNIDITGCLTEGTDAPWSIDHVAGNGGIWSGNLLDKPIKPTASGAPGFFGTNRVSNNRGYKTRAIGTTPAILSGFTLAHGLSCPPHAAFASALAPYSLPADFKLSFDDTNWSATWTGSAIQLSLMAFAFCEEPG